MRLCRLLFSRNAMVNRVGTGKADCAHPRHAAQLLQLLWAQAGQDALLQLLLAERISRCSLLPGGCFPLLRHVGLPQLLQKLVLQVLKIIQPMMSLRTLADLERRSTVGTYCVSPGIIPYISKASSMCLLLLRKRVCVTCWTGGRRPSCSLCSGVRVLSRRMASWRCCMAIC